MTTYRRPSLRGWVYGLSPLFAFFVSTFAITQPKLIIAAAGLVLGATALSLLTQFSGLFIIIGTSFDGIFLDVGVAQFGLGDLGIFAALAVWLPQRIYALTDFHRPPGSSLLLVFWILVGISILLGVQPFFWSRYLRLTCYIGGYLILYDHLVHERSLWRAIIVFGACGLANAVIALWSFDGVSRLEGIFHESNLLGFALGMAFLTTSSIYFERRHPPLIRLVMLFMTPVIAFAFIMTISRGSYLSLACALLWRFRRQLPGLVLVSFGLVGSVYMISLFYPNGFEFILRRLRFADSSVTNRAEVMWNAVKLILHFPFFGIGFGHFGALDQAIEVNAEAGRGAHNNYLSLTASSGSFASLTLFIFIAYQFVRLVSAARTLRAEERNLHQLLYSLFIFQSLTLLFRGWIRGLEWVPLAFYSAAATLVLERGRGESASPRDAETNPSPPLEGIERLTESEPRKSAHLKMSSS